MLNKLKGNPGAKKTPKCVGRGIGSGKGKTCGRGGKGQTARSGVSLAGFEGGQMALYRRLPKRGFNSRNKEKYKIINFYQINDLIERKLVKAEDIKLEDMERLGIFNAKKEKVKLLGKGEIITQFNIEVHAVSKKGLEQAKAKLSSVKVINKK